MSLNLTYMVFNLLIPSWCVISSNTCSPIIFTSSVSLFHMIVSPSSRSHFQSMRIQWWPLELSHGYPSSSSQSCKHTLVPCTVATLVDPLFGLNRQKDFRYKRSPCPWIHHCHLLVWAGHQIKSSALIPIVGKFEG